MQVCREDVTGGSTAPHPLPLLPLSLIGQLESGGTSRPEATFNPPVSLNAKTEVKEEDEGEGGGEGIRLGSDTVTVVQQTQTVVQQTQPPPLNRSPSLER